MIPTANIRRTPKKACRGVIRRTGTPERSTARCRTAPKRRRTRTAIGARGRHRRARSASLLGPPRELRQEARRGGDAEAEGDTNEEGRVQLKAGARAFGLDHFARAL